MCGINGFNFKDETYMSLMNKSIKHRGPDDTGVFASNKWTLGNNRLAVIDLSARGHQPMKTEDGRFVIALNGEIYNFKEIRTELSKKGHTFFSDTDTEVVLRAYQEWGVDCLTRLNGMFAFAILDTHTEEVFLVRDRIGIKPLYYYHKDEKFIFSSEVKSIFVHDIPQVINKDALNVYFRMLYVPAPMTMWNDIYKLLPGHYALLKGGQMQVKQYWSIEDSSLIQDKEYLKSEISRLLHESVEMQTISDRSVGVFLSGGIDSTIIAGIMSSLSSQVKTFSVGFEKTPESEKYNNDLYVARRTASYFGTDHHEYILTAKDIEKSLEETVYFMDEPISNHIQTVNLLLSRAVSDHATVVLGGDGADELFGGYERYYYNNLIDLFQRIPPSVRGNAVTRFGFDMFGKRSAFNRLNSESGVGRYLDFFAQKEDLICSFLRPEYNDIGLLEKIFDRLYFKNVSNRDFTHQMMRVDIQSWLPDESLVRSDKMSMAASIEQRVPFLDHRLVELADRIPTRYKIGAKGLSVSSVGSGYKGKIILKEAMSEYLPQFVLDQPKWGWFSPAAKWVRGDLNSYVKEVLSPSYCKGTEGIFDFGALNQIFEDHVSGKKYALNTIWSVLTFQLWYKKFMESN